LGRAAFYAAVSFTGPGSPGSLRRMRVVGSSGGELMGVAIQ